MSTYAETTEWLFAQLPMFQRQGASAYKADLSATLRLMEHLNHPERSFKSIHVGGTNGKGSVSHALAAVFQKAGYKTGLYTSPHLLDFRERIRINGNVIPERDVVHFVEQHKTFLQEQKLSFFEMSVGMAFDYFRAVEVDIAIVEVGMGGRLDSTNVVVPELSVITNISLDHTQFLGPDRPSIAGEKAGIIKTEVPVVIGERHAETDAVFERVAREKKAPLYWAEEMDMQFDVDTFSLKGPYQKHNVRTVNAAILLLQQLGWTISSAGLSDIQKSTGLRGRWELLGENPTILADTGHNEAAIRHICERLAEMEYKNLLMVWGMVGDKDSTAILKQLPKTAHYLWCAPDLQRAKAADQLAEEGRSYQLEGEILPNVKQAVQRAIQLAKPQDLIFIGGSTFVVAEALELFP